MSNDPDDDLRWETVGKTADWADDRGRTVAIGARRIAIFRHQDRWYAIKDSCPHAGMPLVDGMVADGEVSCPFHGWVFDLATGEGPMGSTVATYPIREREDGMLEVGV